jgi:uncharacterized protein involved in outer membrane biogenesis
MKKVKKILLFGGLGLVVLIVVAVIVAGLFLGNIVKVAVNNVGPKLTQTPLTVEAVDLSLLTGSATIQNLIVGNPAGYSAPDAIRVGRVDVRVNPMSVLSDKIVVKSVRVESLEVTLEGNPLGANNLKKIEDNVSAAASSSPSSTNPPAAAATPAKPGKKLEVDDLVITGAKVHYGAGLTLPLPDIHLTDLGKGPEGITAADLSRQVLSEVVSGAIKTVGNAAANLGKNAGKAVGAEVNKITTGLGGLLKKKTN